MIVSRETLYKLDNSGNIRTWRMETNGSKYRTISGIQNGKEVTSGWQTASAKNAGKKNATTGPEQAKLEVQSKYTKKLELHYHTNIKNASKNRFFKAMLADKWEDRKDKIAFPVATQPKLDGLRAIIRKDGIWSRQGKQFKSVPHIEEQLAPLFKKYPNMILDGELYNHELRDDFNQILSLARKGKPTADDLEASREMIEFHVYDFGQYPDLRFFDRAKALQQFVETNQEKLPSIVFVETSYAESEEEVDEIYGGYIEQGFEGGMIRLDIPYENKRSKGLLKRKDFSDAEFKILEVLEGTGNWAGHARALVIELPDGSSQQSGMAGTREYLKQVLIEADEYIGGEATIHYFNITPDGKLRFPVAKALYKDARDC